MSEETISVSNWLKFFKDAGIPSGIGANYAVIFCDHRIQHEILEDLSREILVDMGIKAMGDIIAILKQARIVSEQLKRENTTKLLLATNSPKAASDGTNNKSVFSRLGQDSSTTKSTQVFKRLGDPVVTTTTSEPSHPSKVATAASIPPRSSKPSSVVIKGAADSPSIIKRVFDTRKEKRKSVLDRLGPETSPKKVRSSLGKAVMSKNRKDEESDSSTDSESSSSEEELKRSPKIIRLAPKSSMREIGIKTGKKIILKKVSHPVIKKKPTVLDRLGSKVSSTTQVKRSEPMTKKAVASMSVAEAIAAKRKATSPSTRSTKLITSGRLGVKSVSRTDPPSRLRSRLASPISSNKISSTTSAGIFRGGGSSASSVFDRLGGK